MYLVPGPGGGPLDKPLDPKVHASVQRLGVASAVSTGHSGPMSYCPGGRRTSRSRCPRPRNPRVTLITRPRRSPRYCRAHVLRRLSSGAHMTLWLAEPMRTWAGCNRSPCSERRRLDTSVHPSYDAIASGGAWPVQAAGCVAAPDGERQIGNAALPSTDRAEPQVLGRLTDASMSARGSCCGWVPGGCFTSRQVSGAFPKPQDHPRRSAHNDRSTPYRARARRASAG